MNSPLVDRLFAETARVEQAAAEKAAAAARERLSIRGTPPSVSLGSVIAKGTAKLHSEPPKEGRHAPSRAHRLSQNPDTLADGLNAKAGQQSAAQNEAWAERVKQINEQPLRR